MKKKNVPTPKEKLTALLKSADRLYDEADELLSAYAEEIRHSNIPGGYYITAWRARGLGDIRVVLREALRDGGQ